MPPREALPMKRSSFLAVKLLFVFALWETWFQYITLANRGK